MKSKSTERIVIISIMTYGDFALLIPFLRGVRMLHPEARITMICGKRGKSLVDRYPWVDEIIDLAGVKIVKGICSLFRRLLRLFRPSVVYALHPLRHAAWLAFFLMGRKRLGFHQAGTKLHGGPDGFQTVSSVTDFQSLLTRRLLLNDSREMQIDVRFNSCAALAAISVGKVAAAIRQILHSASKSNSVSSPGGSVVPIL